MSEILAVIGKSIIHIFSLIGFLAVVFATSYVWHGGKRLANSGK